jgi:hypothetical protein
VSINTFFDIIQQHDLPVEFVAYLHAEFALAANGRRERVELCVLVAQDARVVGVDLLVVEG